MILTNSEIMDINQNAEFDSAIGYARKIESAVLEKLKAQEPVGETVPSIVWEGLVSIAWEADKQPPPGTKLYEHPLPPDDVVRDAERYKWLRDSAYCTYPAVFKACQAWNTLRGETLDAAIDEIKSQVQFPEYLK